MLHRRTLIALLLFVILPGTAARAYPPPADAVLMLVKAGVPAVFIDELDDAAWKNLTDLDSQLGNKTKLAEVTVSPAYKGLQKALGDASLRIVYAILIDKHGRNGDLGTTEKETFPTLVQYAKILHPGYEAPQEFYTISKKQGSRIEALPAYSKVSYDSAFVQLQTMTKEKDKNFPEGGTDAAPVNKLYEKNPQLLAAIYFYTKASYKTWNSAMRNADAAELKKMDSTALKQIGLCMTGLNNLPPYTGALSRTEDGARPSDDWVKTKYKKGSTFVCGQFWSATTVAGSYKEESLIRITIEQAQSGRDVRLISLNSGEHEVLFPPWARFEVTEVKQDKGKMLVTIRELPPPN